MRSSHPLIPQGQESSSEGGFEPLERDRGIDRCFGLGGDRSGGDRQREEVAAEESADSEEGRRTHPRKRGLESGARESRSRNEKRFHVLHKQNRQRV